MLPRTNACPFEFQGRDQTIGHGRFFIDDDHVDAIRAEGDWGIAHYRLDIPDRHVLELLVGKIVRERFHRSRQHVGRELSDMLKAALPLKNGAVLY